MKQWTHWALLALLWCALETAGASLLVSVGVLLAGALWFVASDLERVAKQAAALQNRTKALEAEINDLRERATYHAAVVSPLTAGSE